MPRQEFSSGVKAQIVKRAMGTDGHIACEGCGLVLGKKPYEIDHTIPDGLRVDKSRPLTADDGKLLGLECCHKPKTAKDRGDIAEAKRREARDLGYRTAPPQDIHSAPFARTEKTQKRLAREPKPQLSPLPLYRSISQDRQP